jgi:hypothetical protein
MNGRKKEPWRRPPKNRFKPPQSASDPIWDQEEPKRPQEPPRMPQVNPTAACRAIDTSYLEPPQEPARTPTGSNHRSGKPSREDSIWFAQWQDARDRRDRRRR